jgi:hypothetical protein
MRNELQQRIRTDQYDIPATRRNRNGCDVGMNLKILRRWKTLWYSIRKSHVKCE